tara:strand:- start:409 stop:774 length:366 start_codon:yes stop_codon:yes gene_type:complete
MKLWKPLFIENSSVPKFLSHFAPIEIGAISLGFLVFSRVKVTPRLRRHETIHFQQQIELLFIGFYVLYLFFWLLALLKYKSGIIAYFEIPFEREAHANHFTSDYLEKRKRYSWIRYIKDLI